MRQYLRILRTREARRLLLSTMPARLAYSMVGLSLFFHVLQTSDSLTRAGLTIGINGICGAVSAGVRGSLMDRYGQTWLLYILVPSYTAMLLVVSFSANSSLLLAAAAVLGITAPPINMSSRPLWKIAVTPDLLRSSYALDVMALHSMTIFGPILSSTISLGLSGSWALRTCALLIFIGGMALATSPVSRRWIPEEKVPGAVSLWKSPGIRLLMLEGAFIGFGWGAFDVGLPASATLADKAHLAGPIFACMGVGTVLGVSFAGVISKKVSSLRAMIMSYGIWVLSVLPLLFIFRPSPTLFVIAFLVGLAGGPLPVFYWEVLDAVRPMGSAVAALAWIWAFEGAFASAGAAVAGHIAETWGARYALAITPLAVLCGFMLILFGRRILAAADRIPSEEEVGDALVESEDARTNG
ncbi:MAG: MFS transporter [Actinobacteria bacterium]|nr:MFS transporter [Actinomycetota bacterium]